MTFLEGSESTLMWTSQHGCGGTDRNDPHNINCNLVLQYTCDTKKRVTHDPLYVKLSNGSNTQTPGETTDVTATAVNNKQNQNNNAKNGRHESEGWYASCATRSRNKGLFTADQNLNNKDTAIYTRQNNNGNRSGLECDEERDYYPYWYPTPWIDIAYLTSAYDDDNVKICDMVSKNTMNTNTVYRCEPVDDATKASKITQEDCQAASGTWKGYTHNVPAPICRQADWSRDNHLGNGRAGQLNNQTWIIPSINTLENSGGGASLVGSNFLKCVHRVRYNITTDDYDPWNTYADSNNILQNNPTVDIGVDLQGLQLNINTAQFGRTFQDRSHIFTIRKRPAVFGSSRIVNLNIFGKRGNVVQSYPSQEYDFFPGHLTVSTNDYIHVQWTGSNTHNNGPDGGDGQTGDDGQGQTGTDRCNFVLTASAGENWPLPLDVTTDHMWLHTKCYNINGTPFTEWIDCAVAFASGGYYRSVADTENKTPLDNQMNNGNASFIGGVIMQVTKPGTYYYICSRNNNFTNRSQKGTLVVV